MAIKGKTKRSRGRAPRRVTPGPRPTAIERRAPWYKAPAFAATVAIVALLVTLVVAVDRMQFGWARDDVERFTRALETPMSKVTGVAGAGADGQPGFASVNDFASGGVKAADVVSRAQTWQQQLGDARQQISAISLGEAQLATDTGVPANTVGGRVRELSAIRDAYLAGIGFYDEAALVWQQAGEAVAAAEPGEGERADNDQTEAANAQRDRLIQSAQSLAQKGQQALDAAAALLAVTRARYDLSLTERLPGESTTSYSGRYIAPAGDPASPPGNVTPPTATVPTETSAPASTAPTETTSGD